MSLEEVLRALAAAFPGPESTFLHPGPDARRIPATWLLDDEWLAAQLHGRSAAWQTGDRHVVATLWWYSATHVLVTPTVAALLVTGYGLDPALDRVSLHHLGDGRITGADSAAVLGERGADAAGRALYAPLAAVIETISAFTAHGERPLWALVTDGIANRLLTFARPLGDTGRAGALAEEVIAGLHAAGAPLPMPRFVDTPHVAPDGSMDGRRVRFVRRCSCCLIYRVPGQELCSSCPRRPAASRAAAMREATRYF